MSGFPLASGGGGDPSEASPIGVKLILASDFTVNDNQVPAEKVTFGVGTVKPWGDVLGMHSAGGPNPERITIPTGYDGIYEVDASLFFQASVGGSVRSALLEHNNSANVVQEEVIGHQQAITSGGHGTITLVKAYFKAVAGDYFQVRAYQNAGGALLVQHTPSTTKGSSFLSARRIGIA